MRSSAHARLAATAVGFIFMCGGLLLGNVLRDRHESGRESLVPSEVYATASDDWALTGGKPAGVFFDEVRRLLLHQYVDPITDETKLARGALQFLLQELRDTGSRYYEPEAWNAYLGMFEGRYAGIGADIVVLRKGSGRYMSLPLTIVSLADGGPGQRAGLRPGDVVEEVDGKWVASRSLWSEVDAATERFSRKEITREQLDKIFNGIRERSNRLLPVLRALHELQIERSGWVKLQIIRGGKPIEVNVERRPHRVPVAEMVNGRIRLRSFSPEGTQRFRSLVAGKEEVTIDLRGNPGGSLDEMLRCLEVLVRPGAYAKLQREPDRDLQALALTAGVDDPPRIKVLVDKGTAHEAELFAAALRAKAGADVVGGPTFGLGLKIERFALPDGSGYTVTSGRLFDLSGRPLFTRATSAAESAERPAPGSPEDMLPDMVEGDR